jgi:hypothetical protein
MSGLSGYWAYHSGAVALRVVVLKAVKTALANIEAPKGKRKTVAVTILGKHHEQNRAGELLWPIDPESYANSISQPQALMAVKNLPLKNPSGCEWEELWQAYKERYSSQG